MGKYEQIIEWVFNQNYQPGSLRVAFGREELAVLEADEVLMLNIVEEKHYELVPRSQISDAELQRLIENEP